MKKGDVVFFIRKGVVKFGLLVSKKDGIVLIKYTNGVYQKHYRYKIGQIAKEIEGGINGRIGEGCSIESNTRFDRKNSEVFGERIPNKKGQGRGDKVLTRNWSIWKMA